MKTKESPQERETIKNRIDQRVAGIIVTTGRHPEAIYLTAKDAARFADELSGYSFIRYPPSMRFECPHCGHSLMKYQGMEVRIFKDGDIVVE